MNQQSDPRPSNLRRRQLAGIVLLLGASLGAAVAAPITGSTPGSRALPATKFNPGVAPAPRVMLPDIIADGGGVTISGRPAPFNSSVAVNSTNMLPLTPVQRAHSRNGEQPCRFIGSFRLKNVGDAETNLAGFDAYTWVEQPQGPQAGKIGNVGYGIPAMKPGATYTQPFSFDVLPGSYVFHLTIDPYHRLKQATPGTKAYQLRLLASCGFGGIPQMRPTSVGTPLHKP